MTFSITDLLSLTAVIAVNVGAVTAHPLLIVITVPLSWLVLGLLGYPVRFWRVSAANRQARRAEQIARPARRFRLADLFTFTAVIGANVGAATGHSLSLVVTIPLTLLLLSALGYSTKGFWMALLLLLVIALLGAVVFLVKQLGDPFPNGRF